MPATATFSAQTLNAATSTLTVAGASDPAGNLGGYVVRIDTGAQAGKTCRISGATANAATAVTCQTALSAAPAVGDQISICHAYGYEGIHPTDLGNANIANGTGNAGNGSIAYIAAHSGG